MDLSKLSDEDLKAIADGNMSAVSDDALKMLAGDTTSSDYTQPAPKKNPLLGAAGSFASGFNRMVTSGLPGLPVDTGLNVVDLPQERASR